MEWNINYEREDDCYCKLVVHKGEGERVLGFHYVGPHAGEVTQGFAALILKGATKEDFDRTVGIHPTAAEVTFLFILGIHHFEGNCWIPWRKETRMLRLSRVALLNCDGSVLADCEGSISNL